ncbi:ABC transporter ATP-binding protein [Halobacillus massiliensis]|uniref:ABC transporter ATP-binding protein n=1 Tax=Halobacillus massiliensis TaxID=1926286 RepID=UPI0009E35CB7|nr:ABC transporter ATP-binding protein [Halobacillus massiliensis]
MNNQKGAVKDFFSYIKAGLPAKWVVAAALILSLLETAASLIVPLFTRDLVDQLAGGGLSTGLIIFLGVTFLIQTVSGGFSYYILAYTGEHIVAYIRRSLWSHIVRLPVSYFDEHESGETMSRITQDTTTVKNLISNHLVSFVTGVITIIGAVVILLTIDWRMTLIMLSSVPVALFVLMPLGRIMYRVSRRLQDEMAAFSANLGRVLSEIRLVKSSNAEEAETEKGSQGIGRLFTYGLKEAKIQAIISPFVTTIIMVVLVVLIGYGGVRVASGALSAGSLVAVIIYVFQIIVPFSQMATFFTAFQKAMGATERIQGIHRIPVERSSGEDAFANDGLRFQNVSFSYKGSERVILKGVSFTVLPGETVALVGPSGAGKTTVFSLIERFYPPTTGEITIGEADLKTIGLERWRRAIGYVSQDSPVMSGTIRDNICYGLNEAVSDIKVQAALRQANAYDFVMRLEDGMETWVGERGIKLSGGQRQRIAIARALLRNPAILLLDEATSNLDSESEAAVQEALRTLMEGRTTLVIAHRLSTVADADQLLMLEDGMITGKGSHHTLYAENHRYRELVDQQML